MGRPEGAAPYSAGGKNVEFAFMEHEKLERDESQGGKGSAGSEFRSFRCFRVRKMKSLGVLYNIIINVSSMI